PVEIRDLHATMLYLLGFDHHKLHYSFQGLEQKLTSVKPARVVAEILALATSATYAQAISEGICAHDIVGGPHFRAASSGPAYVGAHFDCGSSVGASPARRKRT